MRLDREGAEFGAVELVELLLGFLVLVAASSWNGNRAHASGTGAAGIDVADAAHHVFDSEAIELGAIGGDELGVQLGHRDRLVTVVGDHEKHGQNTFLHVMCAEDIILRRRVIEIDRRW